MSEAMEAYALHLSLLIRYNSGHYEGTRFTPAGFASARSIVESADCSHDLPEDVNLDRHDHQVLTAMREVFRYMHEVTDIIHVSMWRGSRCKLEIDNESKILPKMTLSRTKCGYYLNHAVYLFYFDGFIKPSSES